MSYEQEQIFKRLMFNAEELLKEPNPEIPYAEVLENLKKEWTEECCRRATGEEAAEYMERFVNVMSHKKEEEEFVQKMVYGTHRTLNQSFFGLMFKCIVEQAKCAETSRYDLRNEASVKLCKQIADTFNNQLPYMPFI